MWECDIQHLERGRVQRFAPRLSGTPVTFGDALRRWREDAAFQSFFVSLLRAAPFPAYRWETPPVTAATADRPFQFVLLDTPGLDREPEPHAFAEQFRAAVKGQHVVRFPNLGRDAVLVVPCPAGPADAYVHLASFVRHAPEPQVHALWQAVGEAMEARLGVEPAWLSTAGMGVAWLHVRVDDRPKYYGHRPYREPA